MSDITTLRDRLLTVVSGIRVATIRSTYYAEADPGADAAVDQILAAIRDEGLLLIDHAAVLRALALSQGYDLARADVLEAVKRKLEQ